MILNIRLASNITCILNIRLASNKVAMARYGLILSQNEAYHFQKAFPIAPGPPKSIYNSKILKKYSTNTQTNPHMGGVIYFPA